MTIKGYVVIQKVEKRYETEYKTLIITDGTTVDVCRTSDAATMKDLEQYSMGDEITICITQNVYKEKVYNTIEKIVYEI